MPTDSEPDPGFGQGGPAKVWLQGWCPGPLAPPRFFLQIWDQGPAWSQNSAGPPPLTKILDCSDFWRNVRNSGVRKWSHPISTPVSSPISYPGQMSQRCPHCWLRPSVEYVMSDMDFTFHIQRDPTQHREKQTDIQERTGKKHPAAKNILGQKCDLKWQNLFQGIVLKAFCCAKLDRREQTVLVWARWRRENLLWVFLWKMESPLQWFLCPLSPTVVEARHKVLFAQRAS